MAAPLPNPREPLDPQVARLYALLDAQRSDLPLEPVAVRRGLEALRALFPPAPGQPAEELSLPGPAGTQRALLFRPSRAGPARRLLLYLHGGGWVGWSPESHAALCQQLAREADALVVSLDYRLAPEHRYPAALEDCVAALRHLRRSARELGADPERVALGGDSAGGNLAAATTLRLRANGEASPAALLLLCPGLDMAFDTPSYRTFAPDDPLLSARVLGFFRDCYARPEQWSDPFVSPLRAELWGFPPTCVAVGRIDPLCDDGRRFVDRLRAAGRDAQLHDYAGMPHEFMLFAGLDAAARCIEAAGAFLRTKLR